MSGATSMAAALAANIPQTTAAAPQQPANDPIPASMSQLIDVAADIPLESVQLDGLVVSKILKHSAETSSLSAHGLLLGIDLDGILEVSNCFSLPTHALDDDDKPSKSIARYQTSMLRSLKEVQGDDSVVGFYQATSMGAFFSQNLIEIQASHQDKLRHGGIVLVHDHSQSSRGNVSFRAFRLTPAFLDAYKKSKFGSLSIINHRLTFSSIMEEVPVNIRVNPLLSSFLGELSKTPASTPHDPKSEETSVPALPPSFPALNLGAASLTKNLESILEAVENYRIEEGNLAYMSRQTARERARAEALVAKRKEENLDRIAQGLVPLPEEDISRLFKVPPEPSRLDSLLLLGQVDAYAKNIVASTGAGLVKMYAAKATSAS